MYTRAQKESSSVSPTSTHKKSNSSNSSRSFSVQRQPEINSSQEKEIPSYSRNAADSLAANVMRSMAAREQGEETQGHKGQEKSGAVSVAQVVMPKPELPIAPVASVSQPLGNMGIQRQCSECEQGMEEGKDSDEMSSVAGVQTKLTVGAVGDRYEQEADQMAQQVMSMPAAISHPPIQRLEKQEEEKEPVQTKALAASITPLVQRETAPEELEEEKEPRQMKRSLQETAEVSIQRDGTEALPAVPNYQLTPPSLLQPPDPSSRYGLGQNFQLHLDPQIQAMAFQHMQQQMEPATIRAALSQVNLGLTALPAPSASGPTATPTPNPFATPSPSPSTPLVPRGAGPNTPRPATAGNLMKAVLAVPVIDAWIKTLKTQATEQMMRDWRRLSTGEQVGAVSSAAAIGAGALAGILSDPNARKMVLSQLNGRVFPVPGLNWLSLEINTGGNNLMLGGHVDIGSLLPRNLGFGPSSAQAIGGPPTPQPFVPGQPTVQREATPEAEEEKVQMKPLANAMIQREAMPEEEEKVQTKPLLQRASEGDSHDASSNLESQLSSSKGGGSPLSDEVRSFMEPRFGADFSSVRVHTGSEAVQMNRELGAQAFAHGSDVYFGAGKSPGNNELTAHELTHVVQQVGTTVNGTAPVAIHRKEVRNDSDIRRKQDWTTADRQNNTKRWKEACLTNLNAVDSSQYVKVVERRDFYKWFYEYTASLGYTTRWALAAYVVANGAHQIADMDAEHSIANDALGMANVELQGVMREGNQVIFDNVLPKLKKLLDGGSLKGRAALNWDMQVLAEEQTLIQPMYSRMSKESVEQLNYLARKKRFAGLGAWWTGEDKVSKGPYNNSGTVPGFDQPNIQNIGDRWKYGMNLGNMFTPGGSGFDPNKDTMPTVGIGYQNGSEFAKVDTRANLHQLDAWLNPNRWSRVGSGSDIQAIINKFSAFEKQQVLSDHSLDGWAYSTQFAQFSFITEAMVKQALPSEPSFAGAVAAFLARYKAERTQVEMKYPIPMYFPMGM